MVNCPSIHGLITSCINHVCRLVVDRVSDLVDYWVTFNEPHVFCLLTYCAGAWPGGNPDMLEVATSALPTGVYNQTLHWMAIAHSKAYDYIHEERWCSELQIFFSVCHFINVKYEVQCWSVNLIIKYFH